MRAAYEPDDLNETGGLVREELLRQLAQQSRVQNPAIRTGDPVSTAYQAAGTTAPKPWGSTQPSATAGTTAPRSLGGPALLPTDSRSILGGRSAAEEADATIPRLATTDTETTATKARESLTGVGAAGSTGTTGTGTAGTDTSQWDTDQWPTPQYTTTTPGGVMPGWDATNWNDPNMQTPKYVAGRIFSQYDPSNPDDVAKAVAEIQKAYPGATFDGKDKLTIPGLGTIDVIVGAGGDNPSWSWQDLTNDVGTTGGGGGVGGSTGGFLGGLGRNPDVSLIQQLMNSPNTRQEIIRMLMNPGG